jgi:hypothetical protein
VTGVQTCALPISFRQTRERLEGLQAGPAELTWHEAVLDRRGD